VVPAERFADIWRKKPARDASMNGRQASGSVHRWRIMPLWRPDGKS
jgi:hypothetical protein